MAKIFDVSQDLHESPNRNTFDLQHKCHMTGKAGYIYPFLVLPHVPTDSFEIDTGIGANFMPMWYPTQSGMRMIVHYFDIPYRLVQKNWKNMLEGLVEEDFPYMDVTADYYRTSSLADYLGIPTNLVISESQLFSLPTWDNVPRVTPWTFSVQLASSLADIPVLDGVTTHNMPIKDAISKFGMYGVISADSSLENGFSNNELPVRIPCSMSYASAVPLDIEKRHFYYPFKIVTSDSLTLFVVVFDAHKSPKSGGLCGAPAPEGDYDLFQFRIPASDIKYTDMTGPGDFSNQYDDVNGNELTWTHVDMEAYNAAIAECEFPVVLTGILFSRAVTGSYLADAVKYHYFSYSNYVPAGTNIEVAEHEQYCPYYNINNTVDTEKVSSFAFRAYEMCYNAFYRNWQGNQLYYVDGVQKFNEYIPNDGDGSDHHRYELHSRNWELDAYTSCLPSPQQGDAPVISVNSFGRMSIMDADGTTSTLELSDLPNGEKGIEVKNADIANPEHARLATSLTTSGLSIADFRSGNALQRFLEQSLRSGYRYADFIFGHFGKSPSHQELDMPVFIGGYTQSCDSNKIENVTAGDTPLGQFAGTMTSFGNSKHKVKHYCDDYGLILGLVMLVPDAAYSQIMPKHFLYKSRLDFYFPQFAQLGLQPVTYEEVCPIQSHKEYVDGDTNKKLTDTFGYQRPNHEYVWMPDTLHGLFRNSLAGSVVNRRFGHRPVLGDDFLRIKPEDVNDIFAVTEANQDVWIGYVICDIKATRPIPRVVVPSLGR